VPQPSCRAGVSAARADQAKKKAARVFTLAA